MGLLRHFFTGMDVDRWMKYWIYVTCPLNMLPQHAPMGVQIRESKCKSTNISHAFHHSVVRKILGIKWDQLREQTIMNDEVREHFYNTTNIKAFIIR